MVKLIRDWRYNTLLSDGNGSHIEGELRDNSHLHATEHIVLLIRSPTATATKDSDSPIMAAS